MASAPTETKASAKTGNARGRPAPARNTPARGATDTAVRLGDAEFDVRYRVLGSRDRRFDGCFFVAVSSTGVYCRPSCPAAVPRREHVRFYPTAAAAQGAGFRACLRCHPHAVPGSPDWNRRGDVAARAMGLIADGVVDREGVTGLAQRLAYSERHLTRLLQAELGAGPLALARAQRAQQARMLIETSELRLIDVAYAAGFSSVRQFNDTIRAAYGRTPSELRRRRRPERATKAAAGAPGVLTVRLSHREPLHWEQLLDFLAVRAVPGVEQVAGGVYRRTLRLPRGHGTVALSAAPPPARGAAQRDVLCELQLADLRDLSAAVGRCRRLLDLDADPATPAEHLAGDLLLAPLVRAAPGRRVPGTVDGAELAIRAVLGQQISVPAARTAAARLTQALGEPLSAAAGSLTHLFPTPAAIAAADPALLGEIGALGPRARQATLHALCAQLADGEIAIDPGADREQVRARLLAIPGVGPWTERYIALRGLSDPDAFLPSDLGVRRALAALTGLERPAAREVAARAERWRPWRAYALLHLWALPIGGSAMPPPPHAPPRSARAVRRGPSARRSPQPTGSR